MMKIQVISLLALGLPILVAAQNRKPNQRPFQQNFQPQQQQQPQFTNRFNPDNDKNDDQQRSFNSQQQPQQQQVRFTNNNNNNNNNNNFNSEPRRESTTFIPIIRFDNEHTVGGGYKTLWETGNNILAEETGVLKTFNDKDNHEAVVQQGSYSYTSPEGQLITVQYTADENGFRASGDHLPTPPPVPVDIQKSLDLIYAGIRQQQGNQPSSNNNQRYDQQQYNDDQQQYNNNNNNNNQQFNNQQQARRQDNINFRPTGNRNIQNNNNRG